MTAFKFRLDSALRLRRLQSEQERAKLQELNSRLKRLERALESIRQEREQAASFVASSQNPASQDLRALSLFSLALKAQAERIGSAIAAIADQITQQKQRVLAAEREEMSLEKLREKRLAEWNVKVMREIEANAQELWLAARTNSLNGRDDDTSSWREAG